MVMRGPLVLFRTVATLARLFLLRGVPVPQRRAWRATWRFVWRMHRDSYGRPACQRPLIALGVELDEKGRRRS